ncbi:MAG: YrdB family protein [Anaerolineae bacterium]|nr:YrdB family protein [Anaerolineae bacterium]
MSSNPLNLAFRFFLELAGLAAIGYWGWNTHEDIAQPLWTIGLILVAAVVWGTFRVPDDPGKAPVVVPGWLRLLIEIVYFGGAVVLLNAAGQPNTALILGIAVLVHYALSYDRIRWLLTER